VPNLSILKSGKARAIRFSTLEAICAALDTTPGAILEFQRGGEGLHREAALDDDDEPELPARSPLG
jgi:hypothetical protein